MPHGGRDAIELRIECARSHHVARVVRTPAGLVFESVPSAPSHGDRDRHDHPHHGAEREAWVDFVDVAEGRLPTGCECGSQSVDADEVRGQLAQGAKRWVL